MLNPVILNQCRD